MKQILAILMVFSIWGCTNDTTAVSEKTFIHKGKLYRLVGNDVLLLTDFSSSKIKLADSVKPALLNLGESSLSFVKKNASAEVRGIFYGNTFYYTMNVLGLNDLRDNYYPGVITLQFMDENRFILKSEEIPTTSLVGMSGSDGSIQGFSYNAAIEVAPDIRGAIKAIDVAASIKPKY